MSEITMIKNGELLSVDESCVLGHQESGWTVASKGQKALASDMSSLSAILDRVQALESQVTAQAEQISGLEGDVALASDDSTPDASALATITARVAELKAKKDDGTATQADKMLLGRLSKKIKA